MNDRQLLEAAARAAGWEKTHVDERGWFYVCTYPGEPREWELWDPLTNDGDALRLGAKLNMFDEFAQFQWNLSVMQEKFKDPAEAIRRAIVETAAEIEKAIP